MLGNPSPGDFQFRDVNGDGVIDANDRTILGSYHPDFTWGMTNRFNWKNIDFSFFLQGVEGREVLNLTTRHMRNGEANLDRKSTRLNSSHVAISYAVFCLKKKTEDHAHRW